MEREVVAIETRTIGGEGRYREHPHIEAVLFGDDSREVAAEVIAAIDAADRTYVAPVGGDVRVPLRVVECPDCGDRVLGS